MGVIIEICTKHPGGPTRMRVTDMKIQRPPSGPRNPNDKRFGGASKFKRTIRG
jgi:hypothetical protein